MAMALCFERTGRCASAQECRNRSDASPNYCAVCESLKASGSEHGFRCCERAGSGKKPGSEVPGRLVRRRVGKGKQ